MAIDMDRKEGFTEGGLAMLAVEKDMGMVITRSGAKTTVTFARPEGVYSQFPATEEGAIACGMGIYEPYPRQHCAVCGGVKQFCIEDGAQVCCSLRVSGETAVKYWNAGWPSDPVEAAERGIDHYWRFTGCTRCGAGGKRTLAGQCFYCGAGGSRKEALRVKGTKFYQPTKPCERGHLSERRVFGSACLMCEDAVSKAAGELTLAVEVENPRQVAIKEGKDWYLPTEPCKKCGQIAEKRVNNGECRGCVSSKSKPVPIHKQFPDMVITKTDAAAAGMKVFRTGKECKHGHAGWRWISTGGCLTCQGRD